MINAIYRAFLLLSLSAFIAVPSFAADGNLLLNGELRTGSSDTPEHWTMSLGASPRSFRWSHARRAPPALEIANTDGSPPTYWSQTVSLAEAGWYRLHAEVKTQNLGTEATLKVSGAHGTALAAQSSANWAPMEVYFKVGDPHEVIRIGCGVRATQAGRAFFRNLILHRIFGAPPNGSRQLDLGAERGGLVTPEFQHFIPPHSFGLHRGGGSLNQMMQVLSMPQSEKAALLSVELAKSPPDELLAGDVLNCRVVMALLFVFGILTWLDWRYDLDGSHISVGDGFFLDREVIKSAGIAAFLCLMLLGTWLVTRIEYVPGHGVFVVERRAVGGDEPHYLIMINSLLLTRGLHLQGAYDDANRGGPEAGLMSRGTRLDRHTIVVNRRTGHRATGIVMGIKGGGRWHRDTRPEFAPSPEVYEISVHPPGFPTLMALAVAPMQPRATEVEPDVGLILMLIAWLGLVATYFVGRQVGMGRRWAMVAVSILLVASPWLAYSRAYFPESAIGTALVLGLWALMSEKPILATLAAGVGTIMKPPFALVGAGFLAAEIREKRWNSAIKIAVVLALGLPALAILAHDFWLHRRVLALSQFGSTLLGPGEGLLLYAPWTIFGFVACACALLRQSKDARLARTMALPLFLYLIAVSSVGFGAGYCYGPRYWVAFLPWLALGTVEAMRRAGRYQHAACAVLVLLGIAMAIPGALRYPQLFGAPAWDAWRGFH